MLRPGESERRGGLRRLDDILEGIEQPHSIPIPQLIERVWAMQQPYLITIVVERRRRRRRKISTEPTLPDQPH